MKTDIHMHTLNICDLPVESIKISSNGMGKYRLEGLITPSQDKSHWLPLAAGGYLGCRSFGARDLGTCKTFFSSKECIEYVKEFFGEYGLSILVDDWENSIEFKQS